MNELDQLIERNRRNAKSWTIELRLALKTVNEWTFFFRFLLHFALSTNQQRRNFLQRSMIFFIVVRRENFAFCSTNKIKRLIDFHRFLSKWSNQRAQLDFIRREISFVFYDEEKKIFIGSERLIEMIFSLRELIFLDNSAHWQMRKRTMKVSSFINRLHLSTFDWQKEEKMFVSSTNSLGEKTRQQTNGSFLLPTTQIKRQIRRDWRSSMLNRKSHRDNFSLFIPKIYSSKTEIVRRVDKISRRRIDWKDQHFFSKTKHFVLHSNIFIRKQNSGKRFFHFNSTKVMKNSSVDHSNSLQMKNQRIEDENRRNKNWHFKKKICKIFTKFHNLRRENSLNSNSNHRRKWRI